MKLDDLFESDHQILLELFDRPFVWQQIPGREKLYYFTIPHISSDGQEYETYMMVEFSKDVAPLDLIRPLPGEDRRAMKPAVSIYFGEISHQELDKIRNVNISPFYNPDIYFRQTENNKNQIRIFSTVGNICRHYFLNNPTEIIKFSGDSSSRVKLYDRMARTMAHKLHMVPFTKRFLAGALYLLLSKKLDADYEPFDYEEL